MLKLNKTIWLVACSLVTVLSLSGQVNLKDQPAKGEWKFSPEKIWEAQKAGQEEFGRIAELLITDKNDILLRDFQRNISYIFDANGRFVKSFATQGNGEGQLPFYLNRFQAGDKIVLAAPDKLHFFTRDGVFDHAAENNLMLRFPLSFLNEHEFIFAPNLPRSPVHQKKLAVWDLASGKEKSLVDFSGPASEDAAPATHPGPMLMIFGLTPQVRLADDGNTLIFGRSDEYTIYQAGRDGAIRSSFRIERKKLAASPEAKRRHIADTRIPKEQHEQILSQLPGEMTQFSHIAVNRGLIYVFAVTNMEQKTDSQKIDIFSPQGEYLYRGTISFGDRLKFGSPSNLIIKDEFLYIILENEQGKQTLAKYRIRLPPKSGSPPPIRGTSRPCTADRSGHPLSRCS